MKETIFNLLRSFVQNQVNEELVDAVREYYDANFSDAVSEELEGVIGIFADDFDVADAVEDAVVNCEPF